MNRHSIKLHFCMFERSQRKIIVWIVIKNFGIFFINCKVYMFKSLTQIKNVLAYSKHSNLENE
jgi:uncharacterized metal-binding protein